MERKLVKVILNINRKLKYRRFVSSPPKILLYVPQTKITTTRASSALGLWIDRNVMKRNSSVKRGKGEERWKWIKSVTLLFASSCDSIHTFGILSPSLGFLFQNIFHRSRSLQGNIPDKRMNVFLLNSFFNIKRLIYKSQHLWFNIIRFLSYIWKLEIRCGSIWLNNCAGLYL